MVHSVPCIVFLYFMLYLAAKAFGKFQTTFLNELHAEIMSHIKQETAGSA